MNSIDIKSATIKKKIAKTSNAMSQCCVSTIHHDYQHKCLLEHYKHHAIVSNAIQTMSANNQTFGLLICSEIISYRLPTTRTNADAKCAKSVGSVEKLRVLHFPDLVTFDCMKHEEPKESCAIVEIFVPITSLAFDGKG